MTFISIARQFAMEQEFVDELVIHFFGIASSGAVRAALGLGNDPVARCMQRKLLRFVATTRCGDISFAWDGEGPCELMVHRWPDRMWRAPFTRKFGALWPLIRSASIPEVRSEMV